MVDGVDADGGNVGAGTERVGIKRHEGRRRARAADRLGQRAFENAVMPLAVRIDEEVAIVVDVERDVGRMNDLGAAVIKRTAFDAVLLPLLLSTWTMAFCPPAAATQISVFGVVASAPWKLASAADVNGALASFVAPFDDALSVQLPPCDGLPTGCVEASTGAPPANVEKSLMNC